MNTGEIENEWKIGTLSKTLVRENNLPNEIANRIYVFAKRSSNGGIENKRRKYSVVKQNFSINFRE